MKIANYETTTIFIIFAVGTIVSVTMGSMMIYQEPEPVPACEETPIGQKFVAKKPKIAESIDFDPEQCRGPFDSNRFVNTGVFKISLVRVRKESLEPLSDDADSDDSQLKSDSPEAPTTRYIADFCLKEVEELRFHAPLSVGVSLMRGSGRIQSYTTINFIPIAEIRTKKCDAVTGSHSEGIVSSVSFDVSESSGDENPVFGVHFNLPKATYLFAR